MSEARTGPIEPATLPALASAGPASLRAAWGMLAIVLMMGLLLAPAIFNGFPIIFADTGGYLLRPIEGQLELGRSALYGAFLLAGIAFDFWPVVIVQAAVTCWIIVLTLRAFDLGEQPGAALAVVLVLTLASSLPWYVGQLMLLTLQTGDGITADNNWHAEWVFREHAPHALKLYYRHGMQQMGEKTAMLRDRATQPLAKGRARKAVNEPQKAM